MKYGSNANWHDLVGQTISSISAPIGDAHIRITTEQGGVEADHVQDCCESVDLIRVDGDLDVLIGSKVELAEDDSGCNPPDWAEKEPSWAESVTWTKLTLKTSAGEAVFWVRGASNGYYCETLAIKKINGGSL